MTVCYRGSREEMQALDAFVKLVRATETVTAGAHRHLPAAGLTPTQFGVMEALYHLGPLCQRDIGRKILKSGGNITTVIGNLERRGLVERQRQAGDRRFVAVRLTETGRQLIAGLFPRHVSGIVAELSHLSAAEQEQLARLCRKLGRREPGGGKGAVGTANKGEKPC